MRVSTLLPPSPAQTAASAAIVPVSYTHLVYTVGKATQGLADHINSVTDAGSVAIAHDSRIKSDLFARTAASVLAANGIKVHMYKELMPTPMLSFAVRHLHCTAGIVITASHNPAKYNGYKAYGPDGCQLTLDDSEHVLSPVSYTHLDVYKRQGRDRDEGSTRALMLWPSQFMYR